MSRREATPAEITAAKGETDPDDIIDAKFFVTEMTEPEAGAEDEEPLLEGLYSQESHDIAY